MSSLEAPSVLLKSPFLKSHFFSSLLRIFFVSYTFLNRFLRQGRFFSSFFRRAVFTGIILFPNGSAGGNQSSDDFDRMAAGHVFQSISWILDMKCRPAPEYGQYLKLSSGRDFSRAGNHRASE